MVKTAIFLGSKKFGLNLFKAIYRASADVRWLIICPPDGDDLRSNLSEFMEFAESQKIMIVTDASSEMVTRYVTDERPDIMIVCGYYRILSNKLLDLLPLGVWGIHNSLLPKYRGGAPLVWQMINREELLGSSFFRFSAGVDDGPVLWQVKVKNSENLSIGEASDQIEREWIRKIPDLWKLFCTGKAVPWDQIHSDATYCAQREPIDGMIDWEMSADDINAFILAQAHPYPRAYFKLGMATVRVVSHGKEPREVYGLPGQVFEVSKSFVAICCGYRSAIRLFEVEVDGEVISAQTLLHSTKQRLIS